jgi:SAM-dependent methyltransferase
MHMQFRRLTDDDLPLLHGWLNEPGVVRWWEGDDVSWDAVVRDYGSGSDPTVEHWLATLEGRPVGWAQCYAAADHADGSEVEHWWALGVDRTAAGIDYLVGEPVDRGRGLGTMMIQHFVHAVVFGRHAGWTQVCASPLAANVASVRALERAGFHHVGDFEDDDGRASLMCLDRAASTEWWAGFFDEAYVDTWAADGVFDATEEQVDQLRALLDLPAGTRILDVPCGFGRFAGPLQAAGHEVVAVDGSAAQLAMAERRHPGPDYRRGDMRTPPDGPFDAVLNLFSSFGYFDDPADDVRCLRAWHDVLCPGGVLVIETMHRDVLAHLWGREHDPGARNELLTTDWVTGQHTSSVELDGQRRVFRMRLYTVTELVRLCRQVGFVDVDVFGGLDRAPFDPTTRLVVRAQRARD